MGSIGGYIFRTTFGAFAVVLIGLTALIWVTQALRDLDIVTSQGQTILVFIGITSLIVPLLVLVIAPIALVIAIVYVLNKLGTDSEIIVMNSAGMRPWQMFKPFLAVTTVVSLLVLAISVYFAPQCLRVLRHMLTEVRADLVANIVQPGRFTTIERGLTFHIRERRANGLLYGIVLDDRRNERERITVIAERGEIIKNDTGSFIVLENGSIQRQEGDRDPHIVLFDKNGFDLSQFSGGPQVVNYSVRERFLWELLNPNPNDPIFKAQPRQIRAEFHDRIMAALYPFAFLVIAYAYLGAPRTTRQSRGWSTLSVIGGVAGLRLVGFASTVFGVHVPAALALQYVALLGTFVFGYVVISRGVIIEPPALLLKAVEAVTTRIGRRTGAVLGAQR